MTKEKASARLDLLTNTKAAWEGYGVGLETIAVEFEKGEEEIKKVKKRFNLQGIFNYTYTLFRNIRGIAHLCLMKWSCKISVKIWNSKVIYEF